MCPNLGRMRTLVLMRHAKSDYPEGVDDHERPLAGRGIREAALAGDWLRANAPQIDAVLCSSAVRTRQTLERTAIAAPASYLDRLYGASPRRDRRDHKIGDDVTTLLVVGHEPTTSHLALGLAGPGSDRGAAERDGAEVPDIGDRGSSGARPWAGLQLSGAELVSFHVPR